MGRPARRRRYPNLFGHYLLFLCYNIKTLILFCNTSLFHSKSLNGRMRPFKRGTSIILFLLVVC